LPSKSPPTELSGLPRRKTGCASNERIRGEEKGKNRFRRLGEFAVPEGKIFVNLGVADSPKNGVRRELVLIFVFGLQMLIHLLASSARFGL
jgi:hypothetical protein